MRTHMDEITLDACIREVFDVMLATDLRDVSVHSFSPAWQSAINAKQQGTERRPSSDALYVALGTTINCLGVSHVWGGRALVEAGLQRGMCFEISDVVDLVLDRCGESGLHYAVSAVGAAACSEMRIRRWERNGFVTITRPQSLLSMVLEAFVTAYAQPELFVSPQYLRITSGSWYVMTAKGRALTAEQVREMEEMVWVK
jgi:hypothetical protein